MSTLTQLEQRLQYNLIDAGGLIWNDNELDEALKQALDQYNYVNPLQKETVITLPGDSHEIALDSLTDLINVVDVWWPYDSDASQETWPPNRVRGFRLYWDDARPVLVLDLKKGDQPQTDDEMRVWYVARHTIQDLDSATITTIRGDHVSLILLGAAGHAAMFRAIDLVETSGIDLYQVGMLATWGRSRLREFNAELAKVQRSSARSGRPWGSGWQMDKWDAEHRNATHE